ncbi:AraC family transcriptional regulator [Rhizobium calliandrae]|uniref:AraC family transcriptional regulator n=1 Tax=Rhizobium calliandrae TaxID=1312182 RepID=A0ABT7KFF7_9HYPH|nr:AraC family transcriptional regulator [Rhizobium calliandrae]MDL2405889.1 AraC family transcriptional regulator [Rhizobium calliandrae]
MFNMSKLLHAIDVAGVGDTLTASIDFTTLEYPPHEQFDAFRSMREGVEEGRLVQSNGATFPARQVVWDLGKMVFAYTRLPGDGCIYGWRHLRKPIFDHWYILLPLQSSGYNDCEEIPAGMPTLHCLERPFESQTAASGSLALYVPHDLFVAGDHMANVEFGGGLGSLLADYMLLLHRSLHEVRLTETSYIVDATRALLAACVAPSREGIAKAQSPIDRTIMERARQLIARKLLDADLTVDSLCRDLGLSRARLYRLFEADGGIHAYIRRERLLQTRKALSNQDDRRPICQIAEQWGFIDPSAFTRAFRHEFGISPRDVRSQAIRDSLRVFSETGTRLALQGQSLGNMLSLAG